MLRAMPTDECGFCKLISAGRTGTWVFEDERCVAFLDRSPVFLGHCLVVPRGHHETLLDVPRSLLTPLFTAAQLVARAVQEGMEADGTFVAMNNVVSQSVPHLHIHVIPRRRRDGLRGFFWPRQRYEDDDQAQAIAASIRDATRRLP
jgi:histidine triad (HIT) family protein